MVLVEFSLMAGIAALLSALSGLGSGSLNSRQTQLVTFIGRGAKTQYF